jgi:hypothetical protein
MDWTVRRLNRLIEARNYKKYLEIGVSRGTTFSSIRCNSKTGVDPHFRFDWSNYKEPGAKLFETTSDNFFSESDDISFDCIFIDGLHTFEQTIKDIISSMEVLENGGAILIDDTVPIDAFSALRSQDEALAERKRAGLAGQFWHGDVYKVLFS